MGPGCRDCGRGSGRSPGRSHRRLDATHQGPHRRQGACLRLSVCRRRLSARSRWALGPDRAARYGGRFHRRLRATHQ
eukprot:3964976-Pleurochrysis_carterae.AAC.1